MPDAAPPASERLATYPAQVVDDLRAELATLRAENQRLAEQIAELREALQQIADMTYPFDPEAANPQHAIQRFALARLAADAPATEVQG